MQNLYGQLLRRERLKQNLSLESLCKGICVPSYLSKIERGEVQAGEEILSALFSALGITLETDEAFLSKAKEALEELFAQVVYAPEPPKADWIKENFPRLRFSALHLWAMLALLVSDPTASPELLRDCAACQSDMTAPQRGWLHLLLGYATQDKEKRLSELMQAVNAYPAATFLLEEAQCLYELGRYSPALDCAQSAYRRACDDGNATVMLNAALLCGTCCANQGSLSLMRRHYDRALRLCRSVRNAAGAAAMIEYNIGATYLEAHQEARALRHLLRAAESGVKDDTLTHQKLALCYAALGNAQEAQQQLLRAQALLSPDDPPLARDILRLTALKLKEGYLSDPAYEALLKSVYEQAMRAYHFGFQRFYGFDLIELYTAQRRYKEAFLIQRGLSMEENL